MTEPQTGGCQCGLTLPCAPEEEGLSEAVGDIVGEQSGEVADTLAQVEPAEPLAESLNQLVCGCGKPLPPEGTSCPTCGDETEPGQVAADGREEGEVSAESEPEAAPISPKLARSPSPEVKAKRPQSLREKRGRDSLRSLRDRRKARTKKSELSRKPEMPRQPKIDEFGREVPADRRNSPSPSPRPKLRRRRPVPKPPLSASTLTVTTATTSATKPVRKTPKRVFGPRPLEVDRPILPSTIFTLPAPQPWITPAWGTSFPSSPFPFAPNSSLPVPRPPMPRPLLPFPLADHTPPFIRPTVSIVPSDTTTPLNFTITVEDPGLPLLPVADEGSDMEMSDDAPSVEAVAVGDDQRDDESSATTSGVTNSTSLLPTPVSSIHPVLNQSTSTKRSRSRRRSTSRRRRRSRSRVKGKSNSRSRSDSSSDSRSDSKSSGRGSKRKDQRKNRSSSRSRSRRTKRSNRKKKWLEEMASFEEEIANVRKRERDLEKALHHKEDEVRRKEKKIQEFMELQALEALKRSTKKPSTSREALEALRLGVLRSRITAAASVETTTPAPGTTPTAIDVITPSTTSTATSSTPSILTSMTPTAAAILPATTISTKTTATITVTTNEVTKTTTTTKTAVATNKTTTTKATTSTTKTGAITPKPTPAAKSTTTISVKAIATTTKIAVAPTLTNSKSKTLLQKQQELDQMRQELEAEKLRVAHMKKTLGLEHSKVLASNKKTEPPKPEQKTLFDPLKKTSVANLLLEKLQAEKLKASDAKNFLKAKQEESVDGNAAALSFLNKLSMSWTQPREESFIIEIDSSSDDDFTDSEGKEEPSGFSSHPELARLRGLLDRERGQGGVKT